MNNTLNAGKVSKELGGMVGDAAELLEKFGTQKLAGAKATLAQAQSTVTEGAKEYADTAEGYLRANPWRALAIAAAAGMLVGALVARR